MKTVPSFKHLSDEDLRKEGPRLLNNERHATATVVAWLIEFDRRRLFLPLGYSSLFTYCRDHLHLGEGATYRRIEAARTAKRFPVVLRLIADVALTLGNLALSEAHEDLRQLRNLMRHAIPSGDAAQIVERALKVLLKDVLRKKCGIVDRPRRGDALQKLIEVH